MGTSILLRSLVVEKSKPRGPGRRSTTLASIAPNRERSSRRRNFAGLPAVMRVPEGRAREYLSPLEPITPRTRDASGRASSAYASWWNWVVPIRRATTSVTTPATSACQPRAVGLTESREAPLSGKGPYTASVTGTERRMSCTISRVASSGPRPSSELVAEGMILCESTLEAIALTSSGAQYERPFAAARALEAASSILLARGEAPRYTSSCSRVAEVTETTYLRTASLV